MFVEAIEEVSKYTRPIHTIQRFYKRSDVIPGASTLFFVNDQAHAVTCKHVLELLIASNKINQNYTAFKTAVAQIPKNNKHKRHLKALEKKFQYKRETCIQIKNLFMDCVDTNTGYQWHVHPTYDLAIIKFQGFNNIRYASHAVFGQNDATLKQGKFLCRLGYPFPEFNNFEINAGNDELQFTNSGTMGSPKFPIDGMVTRFLSDGQNQFGIELSTPGLRGQSGGPLFNENGIVYGLQSSTKHLHLGFDIEHQMIISNGTKKKVSNHSFLHLGQCIHLDIIKDFLTLHNVPFSVEQNAV